MFRRFSIFVFVANKVYAELSIPGTHGVSQPIHVPYDQKISAYDFSASEYDKDQSYDVCGTSPVVGKYFSKYGKGDLIGYETINEVFDDPKQLADLEDTVNKILKDLRHPLEQMPEQVKEMAQGPKGGIGSTAKRYASGLLGYLRGSTGHKFSTFLSQNKHSLLLPAEFFRKYTDFLLKHITKDISGYGEKYGIPDELFERLGLLNELDKVAAVCEEYNWEVPVDKILSVINEGILDSYGYLSTMLMEVRVQGNFYRDYDCKDEVWIRRTKAYRHFIAKINMSIYKIMNGISDIQNEGSPENSQGNIQSDSTYDVTSTSNKASKLEKIDLNHLKNAIIGINDANFNSNKDERTKKVGNIDGVTLLGEGYYTFKYSVGSKTYFLKSVDFGQYSSNNNDILFESFDSPYIAKAYRVLYNHVTLKNNHKHDRFWARSKFLDLPLELMGVLENDQVHDRFWVVSEFLDVPLKSLDGTDMSIVRQLASDVLHGLAYLQSQGIVHNALHLKNVQAEQVKVNGKTEYRFKIIDFGHSYSLAEASSLADTPDTQLCGDLTFRAGTDLRVFELIQKYFAKPTEDEKTAFDDFVNKCEKEKLRKKPNMKKLLQHPFITGEPFTTDSQN